MMIGFKDFFFFFNSEPIASTFSTHCFLSSILTNQKVLFVAAMHVSEPRAASPNPICLAATDRLSTDPANISLGSLDVHAL